jgi:hypothetical protein
MWEQNDKNNFIAHIQHNVGQICNDTFSNDIAKYSSDLRYKSFLEIGTWNGMGSTRVFVTSLVNRTDDYIFYSLECNKDKAKYAANLYKDFSKVHILNEVIWNEEPADFYDIFPQCKTNNMYKLWNDVDIVNMKKCPVFMDRAGLPDVFDVLLLDGGEFTTYYEYQLLKNRCRVLMLDDINADKCRLIVSEIESNPDVWNVVKKVSNLRNGYLIAEKR